MAPTILVAGATGNTGRGAVKTLSKLISSSKALAGYQIIALTRSSSSPISQHQATLPNVVVIEQNWANITSDWVRSHNVVRAFIAPHTEPTNFVEESSFHLALLRAGVKYVVRISTTASNVRPDCNAYYPRAHWAIETILSTPEYKALQWTSLQPNVFTGVVLGPAAEFIKKSRETGKQEKLSLIVAKDAPVAIVDPDEVGVIAAHLLAQEDTEPHNGKRYVVNGPEDVTGEDVVKLVEQYIGTKVENVVYKDVSFIDSMADAAPQFPRNIILSIKRAPEIIWSGKDTISTTSKEILEIAAPKRTVADVLKDLVEG